jgi:adenylosuccinate synthase
MSQSANQDRCVVGLFWGDEGKGKGVDLLAENCDAVIRYCGGSNAGHSVVIGGERYATHLLPVGVFRPGVVNVIANGVVVAPEILLEEIEEMNRRGVKVGPDSLRISSNAHVVMPYHFKQDKLSEAALSDGKKIGTTARGIGPCYSDKANRSTAIRMCDLVDDVRLRPRVDDVVSFKNALFQAVWNDDEPMDADEIFAQYSEFGRRLKPYVSDTAQLLQKMHADGKRFLFEGAHGTLLDVDHGTYPYVTSSSCSANGLAAGAGVPGSWVQSVFGVTKAYTSRVGAGPFPTELNGDIGHFIRESGNEYGTTTGRPRRCGWFDAVAGRYSVQVGGIGSVILMHLDTLSGLDELKICTSYRLNGETLDYFPTDVEQLGEVECQFDSLPGWKEDLRDRRRFSDLPEAARAYVERIESALQTPVVMVSVGPERSETISRDS